MIHGQKNVKLL